MSNALKKILFILLIFMLPYMSPALKAMDPDDSNGSVARTHQVNFKEENQQKVQSLTKQLTSYVYSSLKGGAEEMYKIVNFATRSPNHAMLIGLTMAYHFTAVAACYCTCLPDAHHSTPMTRGQTDNGYLCAQQCRGYNMNSVCSNTSFNTPCYCTCLADPKHLNPRSPGRVTDGYLCAQRCDIWGMNSFCTN